MPLGFTAELLGVGRVEVDRWTEDVDPATLVDLAEVLGRAEVVRAREPLAGGPVLLDVDVTSGVPADDSDRLAAADPPDGTTVAVDGAGAATGVALQAAQTARNAVPEAVNMPRRLK